MTPFLRWNNMTLYRCWNDVWKTLRVTGKAAENETAKAKINVTLEKHICTEGVKSKWDTSTNPYIWSNKTVEYKSKSDDEQEEC